MEVHYLKSATKMYPNGASKNNWLENLQTLPKQTSI